MRATSVVAGSLCAILMFGTSGSHTRAQAQDASVAQAGVAAGQAVYLIKGLAGFQTGVVDLGEKLRRRGIFPRIDSHGDTETITDDIIRRRKAGLRAPIILFGYSLGADAAGTVARKLYQNKIPVALMIVFGPVADVQVPPNVARAINYFQSTSAWHGRLLPAPGFRGSLSNLNLDNQPDINHFTIVSAERYQRETIARISALVGRPHKSSNPHAAGQADAGDAKIPAKAHSEPAPARSN